jgi:centromere protein C
VATAGKTKAKPKAVTQTMTAKILAATEQKPQGKSETGNAFINRLCSAISELDDDTYNALDPDVLNWCEPAIKHLSAKVPRPEKVADLDGVSATDGLDEPEEETDPDAEEEVVEDGEEEAADEDVVEEDPEPEPPAPKRAAKPAAKAAPAAKTTRRAAKPEPEEETEEADEEDVVEEEAEDDPPPVKTAAKTKVKAAAAPAPEVKRGRGRPRKDEAAATTTTKPPVVAKKKGNGLVTRERGSGGTYIVAELVTKYPEHSLDQIKTLASKKGSTVADSQVAQVRRFTQTIVGILKKNDMYKPFKAAK